MHYMIQSLNAFIDKDNLPNASTKDLKHSIQRHVQDSI